MKKFTAVLLAVLMLLASVSVFAEEREKTDIVYDESLTISSYYPEGYTVDCGVYEGVLAGLIYAEDEDPDKLYYAMLIAPDEEYPNLERFNDLTEEELEAYAATLIEDQNNASLTRSATGMGSIIFIIDENGSESDEVTIHGIYKGFNMSLILWYQDGRKVSEEDIASGIKIFTDMDLNYSGENK